MDIKNVRVKFRKLFLNSIYLIGCRLVPIHPFEADSSGTRALTEKVLGNGETLNDDLAAFHNGVWIAAVTSTTSPSKGSYVTADDQDDA